MNNYHKQIMAEKQKIRELERLKREREKFSNELQELEQKESKLKRILDDEKVDVEKLEGFSLAGVFMSLVGKKDEKLDQEKQEVLAAQLKWKEASEAKQDAENEYADLNSRIQALGDPQVTYDKLLRDKQNDLVMNDRAEGERALQLLHDIADLKADVKEIQEAQQAGSSARHALDSALASLEKAKNWGTLDMFGGGLISTSMKHSNMDDAKADVHTAQTRLRKFSHELDDIGQSFDVDLSISGGLTFMDYFFDGLIADWMVQDKINSSYDQVLQMYTKTNDTLNRLSDLLNQTEQTIDSLEHQWVKLVESA